MLSFIESFIVLYIFILAAFITSAALSPLLGVSNALTSLSTSACAALLNKLNVIVFKLSTYVPFGAIICLLKHMSITN